MAEHLVALVGEFIESEDHEAFLRGTRAVGIDGDALLRDIRAVEMIISDVAGRVDDFFESGDHEAFLADCRKLMETRETLGGRTMCGGGLGDTTLLDLAWMEEPPPLPESVKRLQPVTILLSDERAHVILLSGHLNVSIVALAPGVNWHTKKDMEIMPGLWLVKR